MKSWSQMKKYYVYLLKCATGELYTGYTVNLRRRIALHKQGKGARFTRCRLPVELVYSEEYTTQREAMIRERQLKCKRKYEKLKLVKKAESINLAG